MKRRFKVEHSPQLFSGVCPVEVPVIGVVTSTVSGDVVLFLHAVNTKEIKIAMAIRYNKPFPFLFNCHICHDCLLAVWLFKFSIYMITIIIKKSNIF